MRGDGNGFDGGRRYGISIICFGLGDGSVLLRVNGICRNNHGGDGAEFEMFVKHDCPDVNV
ncbi:hypothetical protein HMPREF9120_02211 [Neisseria sp. oral taxon 020 str. F0370]|nr:hypothetical protein HMPREF9120_02211 [Neisseria sp. oral taxon 020 str. F0370]